MSIEKGLTDFFEAAITVGTEAAWLALRTQVPFLNVFPLNVIIKGLIKKYNTFLFRGLNLATYFEVIDFKTSREAKEYEKVSLEHLEATKRGDKDEIAKLEKAKIDAARNLIRFRTY